LYKKANREPPVTVIFATCHDRPLVAPDDEPLAAALRARGVTVVPLPWTGIDRGPQPDAPAIVLRSTWDYHVVPMLFRTWLSALDEAGRTVWNDPVVARNNIDKIYLERFEGDGIAIPPTVWLDHVDQAAIRQAVADRGWERAVLKPRIAATAYGTLLVARDSELPDTDLLPARASGALLQEFVPEILERGEVSLMFCDGVFTHAVSKRAKAGDFRVQQDFGGSVQPMTPSAELLTFAERALSRVRSTCLYARVDVVETSRGPLLMELELIEPELFLTVVPAAADRFADAIVRRL
jgi:glutathione synthase/RimK-type ligase-like ATP-grasp enzyme